MGEGAGVVMNDPVDEAKGELGEALKARQPEPSKDAEHAKRQVNDLRTAFTRDIEVLRGRLPEPSEVSGQARSVGGVAAGGLAAVGAALVLLRRRSSRRAAEQRVQEQAVALARELARLDLDPEDVVDDGGHGGVLVRIGVVLAAIGGLAGAVIAVRRRLKGDDEVWEP